MEYKRVSFLPSEETLSILANKDRNIILTAFDNSFHKIIWIVIRRRGEHVDKISAQFKSGRQLHLGTILMTAADHLNSRASDVQFCVGC